MLGAAAVALLTPAVESTSVPMVGSYPVCRTCVSFAEQNINNLLNIILNSGVLGSCGALCSKLPDSTEQTICNIFCDIVGVETFVHLLNHVDLDPIFFCEDLKLCPIADCQAEQCVVLNSVSVQPASGPSGQTFNIQSTYTVINNTGTGEIVVQIEDPSGEIMGDGVVIPGYYTGSYALNFQLNTQPSEDEPFNPGTYNVQIIVCEGECGSKLPHSRILSTKSVSFEITNSGKTTLDKHHKRRLVHTRATIVQDMESFVKGLASVYAEELHWESCIKDVYSVYTSIRSFESDISTIRWGEWKTDIDDLKSALGAVKNLCEDVKSAITDCDLTELGGKLGEAIAKLSSWIGDIEEGVEVALHIISLVEDTIDVVDGIERSDWYEVGTGVGNLINILA
jgi:hypothetical protein